MVAVAVARGTTGEGGTAECARRRSSVVAVALGQKPDSRRGLEAVASAVTVQARLTLMALGLALTVAPVAAMSEPLLVLVTKRLPNYEPSEPCQGLLMDRHSKALVVISTLGAYFVMNGFQVAAVEANARAVHRLRWSLLVGALVTVTYPALYASTVTVSPSTFEAVAFVALGLVSVFWLPAVSHVAYRLALAKRRRWKRSLLAIINGMTLSVLSTLIGFTVGVYLILSYRISGMSGFLVNGKRCVASAKPLPSDRSREISDQSDPRMCDA
jgi:hypothetical protein